MSHVESMESRRLLSAALVDGTVQISGTHRADRIDVSLTHTGKRLVTKVNGARESFAIRAVSAINIAGFKGADNIVMAASIDTPAEINGGGGNDTITGGSGDDNIEGGSGDNQIDRGGGNDVVDGIEMNDETENGDDVDDNSDDNTDDQSGDNFDGEHEDASDIIDATA